VIILPKIRRILLRKLCATFRYSQNSRGHSGEHKKIEEDDNGWYSHWDYLACFEEWKKSWHKDYLKGNEVDLEK